MEQGRGFKPLAEGSGMNIEATTGNQNYDRTLNDVLDWGSVQVSHMPPSASFERFLLGSA